MALDLNDKTANGNNLTNVNSATEYTASLPFAGKSVAVQMLRASSQYLTANDSVSLSVTGNLTVEMWVRFATTPASGEFYTINSKYASSGSQQSWYFALRNDSGTLKLYAEISQNGSSNEALQVAWTPSTDTWYHVAFVFTAASSLYQFFVNGVQVGSDQNGTRTAIYDGTAPMRYGTSGNANNFINGQMTEMRIWNVTKTASALLASMNTELVGNEAGLVAYHPLEVPVPTVTGGGGNPMFFSGGGVTVG